MSTEELSAVMTFSVPGMSCGHCVAAVAEELSAVEGVSAVDVDLESKSVVVRGVDLRRDRIDAAVVEAGYVAVHP